jgi:B12-binding domain/radical SAM domain protein
MTTPALILLHAPSVYDFRKKTILRGPISDLVPSSSIFEMYPIGFTSIAAFLEEHGYSTRIVNIAARMLQDEAFDVEQFIENLSAPIVFGIDLHWLPHAQGSLAIADIVKRYHPEIPIVFGGFSSTYYHLELIKNYPQVDLVIRGDSTEGSILQLVEALAQKKSLESVSNLTWRDVKGNIQVNSEWTSPRDLKLVDLNYKRLFVAAMQNRDISSYLPFMGWLRYPIMPALACRGCLMNCVGCGGSAYAFRKLHQRTSPAFRQPERLADDIHEIASVSNGPVFVIGDIRQGGPDYVKRFFDRVAGIQIPVIIELFWPATRKFMERVSKTFPIFALEVSPESHDLKVRRAYGKAYQNDEFEATIRAALDVGVRRIDAFFMIGLPEQSYESVIDTATYAEYLLHEYGADKRIRPFIGPMAPFVDPGSLAFEHPEAHGYHIFYRTLEEHRQALLEPSWQFTLNYETRWMSRHDIVHSTYDAGLRFCDSKHKYGLIDENVAGQVESALREGQQLALAIEKAHANKSHSIESLRTRINALNNIRVLEANDELRLPNNRRSFKWLRLIFILVYAWFKHHKTKLRHLFFQNKAAFSSPEDV